jgi:hypothetical protein
VLVTLAAAAHGSDTTVGVLAGVFGFKDVEVVEDTAGFLSPSTPAGGANQTWADYLDGLRQHGRVISAPGRDRRVANEPVSTVRSERPTKSAGVSLTECVERST